MVEDAWGGWDEVSKGLDDDECWSVEDEVPWREEDDKFSPICSDSEKKQITILAILQDITPSDPRFIARNLWQYKNCPNSILAHTKIKNLIWLR